MVTLRVFVNVCLFVCVIACLVLCHCFFSSFLGEPAPGACFDRAVKNKECFCFVKQLSIVFVLGFDFRLVKLSSDVLC